MNKVELMDEVKMEVIKRARTSMNFAYVMHWEQRRLENVVGNVRTVERAINRIERELAREFAITHYCPDYM